MIQLIILTDLELRWMNRVNLPVIICGFSCWFPFLSATILRIFWLPFHYPSWYIPLSMCCTPANHNPCPFSFPMLLPVCLLSCDCWWNFCWFTSATLNFPLIHVPSQLHLTESALATSVACLFWFFHQSIYFFYARDYLPFFHNHFSRIWGLFLSIQSTSSISSGCMTLLSSLHSQSFLCALSLLSKTLITLLCLFPTTSETVSKQMLSQPFKSIFVDSNHLN